MLKLNLLSTEYKNLSRTNKINLLIRHSIFVIFFITIITANILLITKTILKNNFDKVSQDNGYSGKDFDEKIKDLNKMTVFFKTIQDGHYDFSDLLIDLGKKAPTNISLSSIQLSVEDKNIDIKGFAKLRDDLLLYEKNLNKSLYLENIDLPLQNITQPENINFVIKANLKLENLK